MNVPRTDRDGTCLCCVTTSDDRLYLLLPSEPSSEDTSIVSSSEAGKCKKGVLEVLALRIN